MRKIKFRGKRVDNGEFIIGNLFIPNKLLAGVFICPDTTYGNFLPEFEDGDNIKEWDGSGISIGHFHEVIPETVGQFTGLKDKKGVDIYEGDIVEGIGVTSYGKPVIRTVVFDEDSARFGLTNMNNQITFEPLKWISFPLEIIGNIHANPSESPNGSKINK